MAQMFPFRNPIGETQRPPKVLSIDEDEATAVFEALSSETARMMFTALHEEPRTASDLAERADTSVQNARYHLEKFVDAGLVKVVDTWYSERGTEMKVYAPTDGSLVVFAGVQTEDPSFRAAAKQMLGATLLLVAASMIVQRLSDAYQSAGPITLAEFPIPLGLLFFLGGAFVLLIGIIWLIVLPELDPSSPPGWTSG